MSTELDNSLEFDGLDDVDMSEYEDTEDEDTSLGDIDMSEYEDTEDEDNSLGDIDMSEYEDTGDEDNSLGDIDMSEYEDTGDEDTGDEDSGESNTSLADSIDDIDISDFEDTFEDTDTFEDDTIEKDTNTQDMDYYEDNQDSSYDSNYSIIDEIDGLDLENESNENKTSEENNENIVVVPNDADFIAPNGEIVVMDPKDNGDNFRLVYVDIENITIVKRIRATNTVDDLIKSIKSTGLLKPIDVAPTAVQGIYVLLDGYRRVLACARAGKRRIPCIVNTGVSIPDIPILEAMYNHSKKYSVKEMIDYIDYLEKQKGIMSASMIEYLLQLNSGDYTKLKDILNDNDEDIVSKLMQGIYTIDQAFKKLEQRRKKESAEEKELKRASKVYDEEQESGVAEIADSGETGNEELSLTENDLKQLAVTADDLNNVDDESLDQLIEEGNNIEGFEPHKQDPKHRERLDPALRKAVLARDNNTCQICEVASGMEFVEVLDVHHIQEVYLGGTDDINNLITTCTVCHKLIHLHGRGELAMRPIEQFSESEQRRFKRIIKLGNKIRVDMKMKGMKVDQLKKVDNTETIGRTKPGTGQEAG